MRFKNFNGAGKAVSNLVAQTLSFTGNDLPSTGVVAYHFATTGAANTFANIVTRLRVKSDGQTIYDVDPTHFRKWSERFTQSNFSPATAATRWSIWFNFTDIVDDDLADTCQFPPGTVPTVEFVTNASAVTGSIFAGWTQTDVEPHFTPYLYGQAMNIALSAKQAQFPIQTPGNAAVRGLISVGTGLGTLRAELNQFVYVQTSSALYQNVATGDMALEMESIEDGNNGAGVPAIATHFAQRIPMIVPAAGSSRVLLDTESTWAGATNELTLWLARAL
jgi:hypothetical protein